MAYRQIPLGTDSDYTQQCDLDGTTYTFRVWWSRRGQCWHMDLRTLDGTPIVLAVRLVAGWPLLYRAVGALRPPGEHYLIDHVGPERDPGPYDLGTRHGLYYREAGT